MEVKLVTTSRVKREFGVHCLKAWSCTCCLVFVEEVHQIRSMGISHLLKQKLILGVNVDVLKGITVEM